MDENELGKKLKWLEKQRQSDAEDIARLKEKLEGNEAAVKGLQQQIKELASESARVAAMRSKVGEVENALTKFRQDISRMLDESEKKQREIDAKRESMGKKESEKIYQATLEMKEGLRELGEIKHSLETRKEEEIRISRALNAIEKRMEGQVMFDEEKALILASVEEGRKQDSKRMTDILSELADMRERNELVRGSIDPIQDRLERSEVRLAQIVAAEGERRESQELWMEQQTSKIVEFERSRKTWSNRFDEFEKRAEEINERALAYDETYRNLKQLQNELSETQQRIERRIHEIGEMQRLAEDRTAQEWSTFKADEQKRWNTQKLTNDEQWREHARVHEKLASDVGTLKQDVKTLLQGFDEIQEQDRQRVMELLKGIREWAAEVEARRSAQ
jgi:chromosome segregation ATPase